MRALQQEEIDLAVTDVECAEGWDDTYREVSQEYEADFITENRGILEQIREALELIDDDPEDYGICETCDEPIPPRRLELMPWVSLCVRCQEKLERDGRAGRSRKNLTDYQ